MTKKAHSRQRRALEELLARLRHDTTAIAEQTREASGGQASGELSNAPMHLGDMGTEEYLHDLNTTLLENEVQIAQEVVAALKRLDEGTYGRCEGCQTKIAAERLDAIPYTRWCVSCAEANPGRPVNLNAGRPVGPDSTLAPEGEMDEDRLRRPYGTVSDVPDVQSAPAGDQGDVHAAGTAGGGTALGGLAGGTSGRGDPQIAALHQATANSEFDVNEPDDEDHLTPESSTRGSAYKGTTRSKRP